MKRKKKARANSATHLVKKAASYEGIKTIALENRDRLLSLKSTFSKNVRSNATKVQELSVTSVISALRKEIEFLRKNHRDPKLASIFIERTRSQMQNFRKSWVNPQKDTKG
jgi:hypothetical protein